MGLWTVAESRFHLVEIQFRMRLKHLPTIEYYLQEAAAISALSELDGSAGLRVRVASLFFEHLASSSG